MIRRSARQATPLRPNRGSHAKAPKRVKAKRSKPRRGRVVDPPRLKWCAQQACCVTGERPATVHHVRRFGSPKDDTRIIPLVARLHMRTHERPGEPCVERGKRIFEAFWMVDLEALVLKFQRLYDAALGPS